MTGNGYGNQRATYWKKLMAELFIFHPIISDNKNNMKNKTVG